MKKTLLAASVAALAFAPAAYAQNYQMEGGFSYVHLDDDGFKGDAFALDFTYHLDQVNTQGKPLAEAAFLDRSTSVYGQLTHIDNDWDDFQNLGIGVEAFIEDFYVNANITRNFLPSGTSDTTDFGVRLGFLPTDGLLLTLGYDLLEDGNEWEGKDLGVVSLGGKYVTPLDGEMALNVEAEIGFADDNDDTVVYTLGGDLYFNSAISAGLWLADSDQSGSKTLVGVRGKYFVTPLVSVEAAYSKQDKVDTFGLRAALRF